MMNEEKRDRMIRESLGRYLSGIDALPSQRAAISKSLVDKPLIFRRAAFRAVAGRPEEHVSPMGELVLHKFEGEKVLGAVDVRENIGIARIERAAVGLA